MWTTICPIKGLHCRWGGQGGLRACPGTLDILVGLWIESDNAVFRRYSGCGMGIQNVCMGMLISFVRGSLSAFVVSGTCGSGGKGLKLDVGVGKRSGMVASMGCRCKRGPAQVVPVYYGRPVLTVSGVNKPFETGNEGIGRRGGPVPALWQQQQF